MTAVDFLVEKLNSGIGLSDKLIEQAKSLEKQQIVDAYWAGLNGPINDYSESKEVGSTITGIKFGCGAEQYYTQTYLTPATDKL